MSKSVSYVSVVLSMVKKIFHCITLESKQALNGKATCAVKPARGQREIWIRNARPLADCISAQIS